MYIGSKKDSPSFLSFPEFTVEHRSCLVCEKVCFLLKFQVLDNTRGTLGKFKDLCSWKRSHETNWISPFSISRLSWRLNRKHDRGRKPRRRKHSGKNAGRREGSRSWWPNISPVSPPLAGIGKKIMIITPWYSVSSQSNVNWRSSLVEQSCTAQHPQYRLRVFPLCGSVRGRAVSQTCYEVYAVCLLSRTRGPSCWAFSAEIESHKPPTVAACSVYS